MMIVVVQFDYGNLKRYETMLNVLEYSIKKNCTDIKLKIIKIESPPKEFGINRAFLTNTIKFDKWTNVLQNTNEDVIFLDCDMLVLQDLKCVFDYDFDIGYCVRSGGKLYMNGGAVFVRNNDISKDFMFAWKKINDKMFFDRKFHMEYKKKYEGINQAAFGYLYENVSFRGLKLKEFPCRIWNACREDWRYINDDTKIIHIKSELRKSIFSNHSNSSLKKACELWKEYARDANVNDPKIYNFNNLMKAV